MSTRDLPFFRDPSVILIDQLKEVRPAAPSPLLFAGRSQRGDRRAAAAAQLESHVVEAASIAVPRRRRRAKTDTIDGELLLRTLMAFKRGERECARW